MNGNRHARSPFVGERLAVAAERFEGRVFLRARDSAEHYGEAWMRIRALAAALAGAGLRSRFVGVLGDRGPFAYHAILAALHAGLAYVPLNPRLPDDKLRSILEISELDAIAVGRGCEPRLAALLGHRDAPRLVVLEARAPDVAHSVSRAVIVAEDLAPSDAAATRPGSPDDPAYLMFTSGSTGVPKGVPVSHANVTAYLDFVCRQYGYGPDDIHSQTFELSFDLSVHDMLCAWTTGGALIPFTGSALIAPHRSLASQRVTCWFSVPSLGLLMQRAGSLRDGAFPALRVSLFCGESLPASLARAWSEAAPRSIVENLYGPTEATIAFTRYRWDGAHAPETFRRGVVPIGAPFDGQAVALAEPEGGEPVPDGPGTGELLLAGSQVTGGYFRSPDLTRERFVRPAADGPTWYRTGDLVERDGSGLLHFVGRLDSQIKLHGYRIELAEVEQAVRSVAGTDRVAVVPWPRDGLHIRGLAAVLADPVPEVEQIRKGLKEVLPVYMVPATIEVWDALPLNLNGKIDRKRIEERLDARR